MRINKFLVAAVLATAAGTLIGSFVGDFNMAQPTTPTDERAPFFHGWATAQLPTNQDSPRLSARTHGSIRRWRRRPCAERSSSSISGPTPASTGCARFRLSARGLENTKTKDWW